MSSTELNAVVIADDITHQLGIPGEYLSGSVLFVDGSADGVGHVWYKLHHDGICWDAVTEERPCYPMETSGSGAKEYLRLSENALSYLRFGVDGAGES